MLKTTVDGSCKHFYLSINPRDGERFYLLQNFHCFTTSQHDVIDIVIQENSFQFGFYKFGFIPL